MSSKTPRPPMLDIPFFTDPLFLDRFAQKIRDIGDDKSRFPEIFADDLTKTVESFHELLSPYVKQNSDLDLNIKQLVAKIISCAILFGAFGPLSKKIITVTKKTTSRRGGKKSGNKRREERETTWEPHAKSLIQEFRSTNKHSTQHDVVDYVLENWKLAISLRPKAPTITKLVAHMERIGEVARRSR